MIGRALTIFVLGAAMSMTQAVAQDNAGKRKPGLWEIAVTIGGQPKASTGQYCIDASDDVAKSAGGGAPQTDCSEAYTLITGEGMTLASICRQGNSTVTMTGLLTGDLESTYKGQVTKQYSPPLYGRSEIKSSIEARRLGDCK